LLTRIPVLFAATPVLRIIVAAYSFA
jgi:hypothetical protein